MRISNRLQEFVLRHTRPVDIRASSLQCAICNNRVTPEGCPCFQIPSLTTDQERDDEVELEERGRATTAYEDTDVGSDGTIEDETEESEVSEEKIYATFELVLLDLTDIDKRLGFWYLLIPEDDLPTSSWKDYCRVRRYTTSIASSVSTILVAFAPEQCNTLDAGHVFRQIDIIQEECSMVMDLMDSIVNVVEDPWSQLMKQYGIYFEQFSDLMEGIRVEIKDMFELDI